MTKALAGIHILVTRPDPAGSELCHQIEQQAGKAMHFPVLAFEPPLDSSALERAIDELGSQDWLIFVSPRAVYMSIPLLRRRWPELPPTLQFAAVGAGTTQALHAAGYDVAVQPEENWSSEGLLAMPEFQEVRDKKIALIRGEGGRDMLAQVLTERGASVLHVVAYRRVLPVVNQTVLAQADLNVVLCTSIEGLRNLKKLAGDQHQRLQRMPLIVVSERIKKLAEDLDFQPIWVAKNASHSAILEILAQKREVICQSKPTNPTIPHHQRNE